MRSSSVFTTRTVHGAPVRAHDALRARVSRLVDADAEVLETRVRSPARTAAACSPMPPVKTSVSMPPSAAAIAPTHFRALHVKTSIASAARGSGRAARARSRTSAVRPADAEQTRAPVDQIVERLRVVALL